MNEEADRREEHGAWGRGPATELKTLYGAADQTLPAARVSARAELWAIVVFAVPLGLGICSRSVLYNIDIVFLGHLGVSELAGASLAINLTEMLGDLWYSSCFVLTGLAGQAIGAGNPGQAGNWMQLAMLIVMSIASGCGLFYLGCTGWVTGMLTADTAVIGFASEFNRIYWLGTLFLAVNYVLRQYANGLGESTGPMVGSMATIALNYGFNRVFIYGLPGLFPALGFAGSPLATTCALASQWMIFCAYSFVWKRVHLTRRAWDGCSIEAFRADRVKTFVALAVPATVGSLLEKIGTSALPLLAPRLGQHATACMQIVWNLQVPSSPDDLLYAYITPI